MKGMLTGIPHSSTLAWIIPWMEEPSRLQFMGLRRVGHDWATSLSLFTFMHWRRKWQATPVLPGESQGWSLVGAVSGVTQSRTRLKWLSSGSSSNLSITNRLVSSSTVSSSKYTSSNFFSNFCLCCKFYQSMWKWSHSVVSNPQWSHGL